jgi:type II secretory pathway component PulJ
MNKQRGIAGFSLVELMVAMTLGLLLLAGILTLFQDTLTSNRNLAGGKLLEDELHATLDLISRDLRRAGTMGNPVRQLMGVTNPFTVDSPSAFTGEAANSCLTWNYDLDGNGSVNTSGVDSSDERFGYRLRGGVVQTRKAGQGCTANTPAWNNVTTSAFVQVTALQFAITSATTLGVTQRIGTVSIGGRLVNDSAVTRSILRRVRLRNDGYAP